MASISTPWGQSQSIEKIAPGINFVSTSSHGGFYLDPDMNAKVPAAWRAASWNGQAKGGWYEEDCDSALVILTFPDVFSNDEVSSAQAIFNYFFTKKLAA